MQAEFGISAVGAGEARVELRLASAQAGQELPAPAGRISGCQGQGLAVKPGAWVVEGPTAAVSYTVALPVELERATSHGRAVAQQAAGGLVARLDAVIPTLPADCPVTCTQTAGMPGVCVAGMVLMAPELRQETVESGETTLQVVELPGAGAEEMPLVRLARWASRWAAFRMGMPPFPMHVLAAPAASHLAVTPPAWSQVDRTGSPEQVAHGLMHGTAVCARPAGMREWWAHEGIADYCGRVELARMSAEGDRRLHEWLRSAHQEHAQPAVAPAAAEGELLTTLGALAIHALSRQLLGFTGGSRSIFHLVEALNREFGPGRPYTNEDLVALLYKLSGREFGGFMSKHVLGTEPLPEQVFQGV